MSKSAKITIAKMNMLNSRFMSEMAEPVAPEVTADQLDGHHITPEDIKPTDTKEETKPVEEVKATETPKPEVKEEAPKADPKVEALEAEIAKLQAQIEAAKTKDLQLQEVSRQVEELNKSIKEAQVYKDTVANTLKTKIESIPEDKRSIVPEGTDIQKLEWIANAEKLGIFAPAKDANVEIGKPFNPKTNAPDLGKMTASQLLANAYSK